MTLSLLKYAPTVNAPLMLEPCAGAGQMGDVLRKHSPTGLVSCYDIAPRKPNMAQADTSTVEFFEHYLRLTSHHSLRPRALITNAAFALNAHFWRMGHQYFDIVALLVRISWLEVTDDRADLPDPKQLIVLPRGAFTGPGLPPPKPGKKQSGDMVTVCWIIGGAGFTPTTPAIIRAPKSTKQLTGADLTD